MCHAIAQFRYFKVQLETKDITTRLRGINHINLLYYSPKPRSDVFCFKLNFNISKLGYCVTHLKPLQTGSKTSLKLETFCEGL